LQGSTFARSRVAGTCQKQNLPEHDKPEAARIEELFEEAVLMPTQS
jgi:hypothetical protein